MQFRLRHFFHHPLATVEAALLDPAVIEGVARDMRSVRGAELVQLDVENGGYRRTMRYQPEPVIRRIGIKKVEPRWMAWREVSTYDRSACVLSFENQPEMARIAKLLTNRGSVTLMERAEGTERLVVGELCVAVPVLGALAERVIFKQAKAILDEEAKVLDDWLQRTG